jgi:predicted acylesterase/phospholipase RssA
VNPVDDLATADYGSPDRSCDVVMKGGITSGVVYPHAVCELAQTYQFRNVGGTSAGAIAAAATAAAEYGRDAGGFNQLAELPDWLGEGKNLRDLFQPQGKTRKLYAVLLAGIDRGPFAAARMALREHPVAAFLGALPGLALVGVALAGAIASGAVVLIVVAALVSLVAGLLLSALGLTLAVGWQIAREANREIPDNDFGLCSGLSGESSEGVALAPWLHEKINGYAALPADEPLTFGHLWAGPGGDPNGEIDPDERYLELAMMTTNLVNHRARQLPLEEHDWFFSPEEFKRFFPQEIVAWMEAKSPNSNLYEDSEKCRRSRMRLALAAEQGLMALPPAADFPVLVATRMSLSFPVLLSAVPLWRFDMTRDENRSLNQWRDWAARQGGWDPLGPEGRPSGEPEAKPIAEPCWFSDGGISSNFPVHFFDRLVPRWPTFGINLRPYALGKKPDKANETNNTWMVQSNNDGIAEWWYRFPEPERGFKDKRLRVFLGSIVRTMQNRVDEAQMRVPGYRDRIAHVSMSDEEGGMNLTMPEKRIKALAKRGRAAARRLHDAYTQPEQEEDAIGWNNHRWVRLRSSLSVLEEMHRRFADGYGKPPENADKGERTYEELVGRADDETPRSYPWKSIGRRELAKEEIQAIRLAAEATKRGESVAKRAPQPAPIGKIVPRD